ncbi:4'-phosphopantetheinyl transferase family protein [Pseudonocardia endophytica]|uniref:4'-phosphopantetheinyl transferase EntD n=1 Tax=Pseudonocardia endophytica TaxID=401976 RepID=A0A4R1HV11_PSEEN|nr:4'-phosphopantetheinyl transferase superfamily protein [Pseudonocardia endophytica]TCK24510.1 4'-phosphopantetheinyl transferase EntD [Pseudonocardia endophytica]
MIADVLPDGVVTECAYGDEPGAELLGPERDLVARAVESRRSEVATVRHLARRALGRIGQAPVPIPVNRRGAPRWPDGVVGSMTHCAGYRAAAVAQACATASLGVDAETDAALSDGVLDTVTLPSERSRIARLAARHPDVHWDRLWFSAKESVFKAWYPLTGLELDFDEADISVDPSDGRFSARLLVPGPEIGGTRVDVFSGRWSAGHGLIVTAVHLAAPSGLAAQESRWAAPISNAGRQTATYSAPSGPGEL